MSKKAFLPKGLMDFRAAACESAGIEGTESQRPQGAESRLQNTKSPGPCLLRGYRESDFEALTAVFYDAVHNGNAGYYTQSQLDAWAPKIPLFAHWERVFHKDALVVAEKDGVPIGFGDLREDGVLDHLFVRGDQTGRGIGSALCDLLEHLARQRGMAALLVEASYAARPFFEKRGYCLVREQKKPCRGQVFVNFIMEKQLISSTR